ncbi:RNA polymerase sigma factor [Paeniglutamicibacter sp. MACA_103]|uniref:RNA polymerase sigma factor n=1 Tax=Paeniglutamicibacter sp. MACA_103 TaxID=3377337 RepID=UPI0038967FB8
MTTNPAFELVVRRHGTAVLRMCTALLGPGPDAQDAWGETFLAALRAYPSLAVGANLEAWLITIAKRKAIDILRSNHPVPTEELPETVVLPEGLGQLELLESLASLSELQRKVIGYHYLLGFPYADIPAYLGGNPASLRRAAADGIKALRSQHQEAEEES